jgi:RNA polymerase sigma-70 factor (ECF subfamily)
VRNIFSSTNGLEMTRAGLSNAEVAEIFRRYGHLILRRCRSRIRETALAEDVLQEVFVKIMRHGAAYAEAEAKLPWLYRIADNCCFDALGRRRDRSAGEPLDEGLESSSSTAPEERLFVTRALERLPTRERQVALLAFVEGLTQDQIADEIGWSRQTINRKVKEIRDRLARWLHVS